uniref:Gamma-glutamyl phosphate reductase n=1 Tax=Candidatus Methanomethylicus mesodigestus TaxID=1867258 RepID=A0A7C3EX51_9CREN
MVENKAEDLSLKVAAAKKASALLAQVSDQTKTAALKSAAREIMENVTPLISSNKADIVVAEKKLAKGELSKSLLARLKLDNEKIAEISRMVESVAALPDPVGKTTYSCKLDECLDLYKVTVPFGVIAAIFEARPDALPQIVALCIKSGNCVLLKGGSEAAESNRVMFSLMESALVREGIPKGAIQLIEGREAVSALLKMEDQIDLVIPRGSNEFVKYIQANTRIPVLGHSSGICHIFVDKDADPDKAIRICHDARVQYPAACNAMKILLMDRQIAPSLLPRIAEKMILSGVKLKGCQEAVRILSDAGMPIRAADNKDWVTEYLELVLPIKIISGVEEAIVHINKFSSHHTDAIITENADNAKRFLSMVDSSTVMVNASTRFSDGYRYGLGAEVGISTNKIHARGPVGLEGLVTTKYLLIGSGHIVGDYVGQNARRFVHAPLESDFLVRMKKW